MGAVSIGRARAAERPGPAAAAARPRAREEAIAAAGVPGGRLAEAVRRLAEGAAPEQVWLFGSYARGDFGPDSDIDLLAVVPEMPPGALREAPLAARGPVGDRHAGRPHRGDAVEVPGEVALARGCRAGRQGRGGAGLWLTSRGTTSSTSRPGRTRRPSSSSSRSSRGCPLSSASTASSSPRSSSRASSSPTPASPKGRTTWPTSSRPQSARGGWRPARTTSGPPSS